jgi:hypothetical protein
LEIKQTPKKQNLTNQRMTEMDITDSTELILIDTFFTHLENPNNHLIQEKEVHIPVG